MEKMMRESPASIALLVLLAVFVGNGIWEIGAAAIERLTTDNSPPMVVDSIALRRAIVAPGEALEYTMTYSKREDCHPPHGRGVVRYRVITRSAPDAPYRQDHWFWLDDERDSRAAAGKHVTLAGFSRVPMPALKPGRYALQWAATYECAKASQPITLYGPLLDFAVAS